MPQTNQTHVHFDGNVTNIEYTESDVEDNDEETGSKTNLNSCLIFSAIFCCKSLGLVNYICDVGSDIANGYKYLQNQEEWPKLSNNSDYNYTRALCDNWESYRHVKMGTLTLSIVFIPSTLAFLFLGMFWYFEN